MTRDITFGLLFSLILHGAVLWFASHLRHEVAPPEPLRAVMSLYIYKVRSPSKPPASSGEKTRETQRKKETALQKAPIQPVQRFVQMVKMEPTTQITSPKEKVLSPQPILRAQAIQTSIASSKPVRRQPQERRKLLAAIQKSGPLDVRRSDANTRSAKRLDQQVPSVVEPKQINPLVSLEDASGGIPRRSEGAKDSGAEKPAYARTPGEGSLIEATPNYAVNPKPPYPRLAIRRGYEGTVILVVEVLADGSVREVEISQSSGYSILDRSALKTVQKWRFTPGKRGQKPVAMKVKVPVVFRLKKSENG